MKQTNSKRFRKTLNTLPEWLRNKIKLKELLITRVVYPKQHKTKSGYNFYDKLRLTTSYFISILAMVQQCNISFDLCAFIWLAKVVK